MKAFIVQPYYSFNYDDLDYCFNEQIKLMDSIPNTADIIIVPEYSDVPAVTPNKKAFHESIKKYNPIIRQKAIDTAKRTGALVFANFADLTQTGYRNTTFAISAKGEIVGKYYKAHPAPSEVKTDIQGGNELDVSYSYEYAEPYVLDYDGVRYAFMTCYDFYFYEGFAKLARSNVDVIIGCSHQRSDTHQALEIIGKFLSYNTNAYLLRSAVSLGEDSKICGCSMAVAPDGTMLGNMESRIGLLEVNFNPHDKYYKPAGFKGKNSSHYEYIDQGRRPWLYRNGGSAMVAQDEFMPYPRICAHRGFSTIAPENSMPAFGSAVALGAEEIEFDLWMSKDGELVSIHDQTLNRVSNGVGIVGERTLNELKEFDFGVKYGDTFKGLEIITFEDILKKFASQTIMNIHVKECEDGRKRERAEKIAELLYRYDCEKHCYIMSSDFEFHKIFMEVAPEIARCMGAFGEPKDHLTLVDKAIEYKCKKVQFYKPFFEYFTPDLIKKAHDNNIICNMFYADDPSEAVEFIKMGMDTILTNDFLRVRNAVKKYLESK